MKPYGVRQSYRPGCACCNSKHLHHYRGVKLSSQAKAAKRAAKRTARQRAKKNIAAQWKDSETPGV